MKKSGLHATLFGLLSALAVTGLTMLDKECPGLLQHWPEIASAAVLAALGKWLHSGRENETPQV